MSREEVIRRVKTRLNSAHPRVKFDVLEAGVRADGDWWYVPIFADDVRGVPLPRDFVVSTYANVEDELKTADDLNVLFIPFIPEEADRPVEAALI